jgi:hypothetical protein
MALRDALWLENAGEVYNAGDYRRLLDALFIRDGVISAGDLAVTQNSPTGMSVLVARGIGIVLGTEDVNQALYAIPNDAAAAVVIPAADPTNDRIDLVGIRIRDDEYSGVSHVADLFVVEGTPAGSPVAPTAPDNFLELARIAVAANASSITNANITDTRERVASGVWQIVTSTTRPTGFEGLTIYETDTDKVFIHNGSAWVETLRLGAWDTYVPTLAQGATANIAKTVSMARYCRIAGRTIVVAVRLAPTGAGTNGAIISCSCPVPPFYTAADVFPVGPAHYQDSGTAQYPMLATLNTSVFTFIRCDTVVSNYVGADPTFAIANGDLLNFSATYEAAAST